MSCAELCLNSPLKTKAGAGGQSSAGGGCIICISSFSTGDVFVPWGHSAMSEDFFVEIFLLLTAGSEWCVTGVAHRGQVCC